MVSQWLLALAAYIEAVLLDGDYRNDWLTHLPRAMWGVVQTFGHLLALALGL